MIGIKPLRWSSGQPPRRSTLTVRLSTKRPAAPHDCLGANAGAEQLRCGMPIYTTCRDSRPCWSHFQSDSHRLRHPGKGQRLYR